MVAEDRVAGDPLDDVAALVGLGAVADRVAEAHEGVDLLPVQGAKDRLEGVVVGVSVAKNSVTHQSSPTTSKSPSASSSGVVMAS